MAVRYGTEDKEVFIRILNNYPIIEDKKTDAYNIEKKKKAWEQIATSYNELVSEKRTTIQLKRLWDKIKRNRKGELAEERREMMATGGGPSKPPLSPHGEIDVLIPYREFEIPVEDDSDGIMLNQNAQVNTITEGIEILQEVIPAPTAVTKKKSVSNRPVVTLARKKNNLDRLTEARLELIELEKEQMRELHAIRMEEANYKKGAAKLQLEQEKEKFKKILKDQN